MIAKEVDETLLEAFEAFLHREEASSPSIARVIAEQKHYLIHELERRFSIVWEAVQGSLHPTEQEVVLMEKLHAMIEALRHGFIEPSAIPEKKPTLLANCRATFFSKLSKDSGLGRKRTLRR